MNATESTCDHCGSLEPASHFANTVRWGALCECCASLTDEELAHE